MISFHKDVDPTTSAPTTPATTPATMTSTIATTTTAMITTAVTTAEPTTEELLSASCFSPIWPIFDDKTLIKLNVLDRTKCLGICLRVSECLGFAAESRYCILKLSDSLENLKSDNLIYRFLRQ